MNSQSMEESWRTVDGLSRYRISSCGKIISFGSKKRGSELNPHIHCGYYKITLYDECALKRKLYLLHRLVAIAFIPNPLNLPWINHKNGIRTDNRVDNLEWCTPEQNVHHAIATGLRDNRGEKCCSSILTEYQVVEIKNILSSGGRVCAVAKEYGVSPATISSINNKRTWKHLLI